MDRSPPGSSVHGILQARILEWVFMPSSTGYSQPRDWMRVSYVSCTGRWVLYHQHRPGSPQHATPAEEPIACIPQLKGEAASQPEHHVTRQEMSRISLIVQRNNSVYSSEVSHLKKNLRTLILISLNILRGKQNTSADHRFATFNSRRIGSRFIDSFNSSGPRWIPNHKA